MMSNVITITEAAQGFIGNILKQNPGAALVVGYDNKGCSGHKYTFNLCMDEEIPADTDSVTIPEGRVVIAPWSVMGLLGATLDLHVDQFDQFLVWDNPMAVSSCGCGDSFQLPGEEGCGS